MVSLITAFAAVFLLSAIASGIGFAWLSVRGDVHSPAALRPEEAEETG